MQQCTFLSAMPLHQQQWCMVTILLQQQSHKCNVQRWKMKRQMKSWDLTSLLLSPTPPACPVFKYTFPSQNAVFSHACYVNELSGSFRKSKKDYSKRVKGKKNMYCTMGWIEKFSFLLDQTIPVFTSELDISLNHLWNLCSFTVGPTVWVPITSNLHPSIKCK